MTEETTALFDAVQRRLAEARDKLDAFDDVSDELRRAGHRRIDQLDRYSRTDLSITSREVEAFHAALDAGEVPIYD